MDTVGVVGLGYVGLTMAMTLARKGFTVHGVDTSPAVLNALARGRPHLYEPGLDEALGTFLGDRLHVASALPGGVEAAIICVSTPVSPETRGPELGNLRAAARHVAERCAPDTLVIVRSTVPVGGSRAVVLPELLSAWGRARLAFAPERTIQGQALRELEELPQVVGGLDLESGRAAAKLFERVTRRVVSVSSLEAAGLVPLAAARRARGSPCSAGPTRAGRPRTTCGARPSCPCSPSSARPGSPFAAMTTSWEPTSSAASAPSRSRRKRPSTVRTRCSWSPTIPSTPSSTWAGSCRACAGPPSSTTPGASSTRRPSAGRACAMRGSAMARTLILGGAGFIGYHLAARLAAEGHALPLVDDFSRGRRDGEIA